MECNHGGHVALRFHFINNDIAVHTYFSAVRTRTSLNGGFWLLISYSKCTGMDQRELRPGSLFSALEQFDRHVVISHVDFTTTVALTSVTSEAIGK